MTITDQIKILDRKIMQNKAQYDLDRKAAKISALSSNNVKKYEYLTGEDLGLKPSTTEQTKFEYSPLGKIFNRGLDEDDKKEGLFKRLKNIENIQKNLIRYDDNESIYYTPRSQVDSKDDESQEAKNLMDEIKLQTMTLTDISLLLLVAIKKHLALTFLGCHCILFQLFIMVKLH